MKIPSFYKLTALFLSVYLILFDSVLYAEKYELRSKKVENGNPTSYLLPFASTKIPEAFAHLEESHQSHSGKTILYLQDAHDSLEAQENIAKTIDYAVERLGVKTVYEEG